VNKQKTALLSRQPVRLGLIALALLVVLFIAWRALANKSSTEVSGKPSTSTSPAGEFKPSKEQWAGLKVAEVKALAFSSILTTDGAIAYNDDVLTPVFSPYSGRVSRLTAKLGDVVKKGAPLMAIEGSEFVQARSDVASAKANLDTARTTEKRQHDLFEAGAGALKDWRQAQSDLVNAEAVWTAARGRLRILGKTDAEINALEKSAAGSTEALVTAPIGGTVTQRQVGLGQYIQSASGGASSPVFTIGDLSTVWLVANVRESDAPGLHVGQSAEVTVMALPGKTYKAKIDWVGSSVDPVTHRLPVRAVVQNSNGELKPQMFATFAIATSEYREAPAVPQGAVMHDGTMTRVFVVSEAGGISGRTVTTGRERDGMIEIAAGLRIGEKVITSGTLFIDRVVGGE